MTPWALVPLGEVLVRADETIELKPEQSYKQVTVRLWGQGVVQRREVGGADIAATRQYVVHTDQFILSRIDARNGAFGLVPETLDGAIVSNDFPVFTVRQERMLPTYLAWLSRTRGFIELCKAASEGTTNRVRLKEDRFLSTSIPVPSLCEQQRIVARIEELAARIEEARRLRREAGEEAAALHGALAVDMFNPLSDSAFATIADVADVRGGIQKSPDRVPGANPIRYLTVAHVHRNRISLEDPRFFEVSSAELARWRLLAGDVLIIEGNGSADQIGRTALFRGEIEICVHQNHVIRIRPDANRIDPEFLNLYLNSPAGQDEVQARSRTTSGLRTLSVGRIKQITVPMPPIQQQRHIVARVTNLQARVERLRQVQAETDAELDALLPSVLDRAFSGAL